MTQDGFKGSSGSRGIDSGYDKQQPEAVKDLARTMAGPKPARNHSNEKNPDHEWEEPGSTESVRTARRDGPGPDYAGNSSGQGRGDPQGQQGGTQGGQRPVPPLKQEAHPVADAPQRKEQSTGHPHGPPSPVTPDDVGVASAENRTLPAGRK